MQVWAANSRTVYPIWSAVGLSAACGVHHPWSQVLVLANTK
jgi:hypothetical protein